MIDKVPSGKCLQDILVFKLRNRSGCQNSFPGRIGFKSVGQLGKLIVIFTFLHDIFPIALCQMIVLYFQWLVTKECIGGGTVQHIELLNYSWIVWKGKSRVSRNSFENDISISWFQQNDLVFDVSLIWKQWWVHGTSGCVPSVASCGTDKSMYHVQLVLMKTVFDLQNSCLWFQCKGERTIGIDLLISVMENDLKNDDLWIWNRYLFLLPEEFLTKLSFIRLITNRIKTIQSLFCNGHHDQ